MRRKNPLSYAPNQWKRIGSALGRFDTRDSLRERFGTRGLPKACWIHGTTSLRTMGRHCVRWMNSREAA